MSRPLFNHRNKEREGSMQSSRRSIQPPSARPDTASTSRQLLAALEHAWISHQTRILVPLDAQQHLDVFLLCLERLLQRAPGKPLLVLSSASAQPELVQRWQTARSMDGQFLAQRFPLCFPPVRPSGEQTCICFSTVRALQLQQLEDVEQRTTHFDVIVDAMPSVVYSWLASPKGMN